MSGIKEHKLEEVELWGVDQAREALQALLHTILFCARAVSWSLQRAVWSDSALRA